MDYSSIAQDPVVESPWGSPHADEETFPSYTNADVAPVPLPTEQPPLSEPDQPADDDTTRAVSGNARSDEPEPSAEQPPQQQASPDAQQNPTQRTPPARYHAGTRQQGKQAPPPPPPPPAYRIQAKITGLERTGKKDLILRFDVHVRKKKN